MNADFEIINVISAFVGPLIGVFIA